MMSEMPDDTDTQENRQPSSLHQNVNNINHDCENDVVTTNKNNSSNTYNNNEYTYEERQMIEKFWKAYDDLVILSLFSILGILFRLAAAQLFYKEFGGKVFVEGSALSPTLPLNCLSCLLMGLLCSGNEAMKIIYSRWNKQDDTFYEKGDLNNGHPTSPISLQSDLMLNSPSLHHDAPPPTINIDLYSMTKSYPPPAHPKPQLHHRPLRIIPDKTLREMEWQRMLMAEEEMRQVQLRSLERRIRASSCLLLFPAKKEVIDVVENYADYTPDYNHYNSENHDDDSDNENKFDAKFQINDEDIEDVSDEHNHQQETNLERSQLPNNQQLTVDTNTDLPDNQHENTTSKEILDFNFEETAEQIRRLARVNVADGWDVGTTPEAMKDGILLGLRVGFCGAVSTFSSWNSEMVNLLRTKNISTAFVGYVIGLLLPIISYRIGQHIAVFHFFWRRRCEAVRDERRGYGLRIKTGPDDDEDDDDSYVMDIPSHSSDDSSDKQSKSSLSKQKPQSYEKETRQKPRILKEESATRKIPSIRAFATAIFILVIVSLLSALFFFSGNLRIQRFSTSLLFSPLGVIARWQLCNKLNYIAPYFPLGTFICNVSACALSGSLGSLLAGNPGPKENIVLVSIIAGFVGSLSTLASFLVEVLDRIDPILLKIDGLIYVFITLFWSILIGLIGSQAKNWADKF